MRRIQGDINERMHGDVTHGDNVSLFVDQHLKLRSNE